MAVPSRSAWTSPRLQQRASWPPSRGSCRLPEQPPRPQQPSAMTGPGYPAARVRTPHPPRSRSPSGPCRRSIPGPLHQPRGADGALPPNGRQMGSLLTCRRARTCRLTAIPVSSGRTPRCCPDQDSTHAERGFANRAPVGAAESRSAHPGRSIRAAWRGSRAPRRFPRRARCGGSRPGESASPPRYR